MDLLLLPERERVGGGGGGRPNTPASPVIAELNCISYLLP